MRTLLVVAIVTVTALLVGSSQAAGLSTAHWHRFQTPSGNIICNSWDAEGSNSSGESIECWVLSTGSSSPQQFAIAWVLTSHHQVVHSRPQDGPTPGPVLNYGHRWSRRDLRCKSKTTGLKCHSATTGHGFFLSMQTQQTF